MCKGLLLRHVVAQYFEQLFVEHDDQMLKLSGHRRRQPLVGRSSVARYPTYTGTSVIVSLPKMSITFTATV